MVLRASRRQRLDPEYSFFALLRLSTRFGFFSATLSNTAKEEIEEWIRQWDYESHLRPAAIKVDIEAGSLVEEYFTRIELKRGLDENAQRLELALELARKFSRGGVIIFGDRSFVDFAKEYIPQQSKNFAQVSKTKGGGTIRVYLSVVNATNPPCGYHPAAHSTAYKRGGVGVRWRERRRVQRCAEAEVKPGLKQSMSIRGFHFKLHMCITIPTGHKSNHLLPSNHY